MPLRLKQDFDIFEILATLLLCIVLRGGGGSKAPEDFG